MFEAKIHYISQCIRLSDAGRTSWCQGYHIPPMFSSRYVSQLGGGLTGVFGKLKLRLPFPNRICICAVWMNRLICSLRKLPANICGLPIIFRLASAISSSRYFRLPRLIHNSSKFLPMFSSGKTFTLSSKCRFPITQSIVERDNVTCPKNVLSQNCGMPLQCNQSLA